jgi:hypothetical protein
VTIKLPESKTAVAADKIREPIVLPSRKTTSFFSRQKLTLEELKPAIKR